MSRLARLKLVVPGWAAASLFFTAVTMLGDIGGYKSFTFVLYGNALGFALWILALPLLARCTRAFPLGHGSGARHAAVLVAIVAGVGTAVTLAQWAAVYWSYFPYRADFPTFGALLRAGLVHFLPAQVLIGIVLVLALEGWRVWREFQAERVRTTGLERQLAVARLDALRMQLHPHFLFNTLHAIAGLIVEQPATARRMVIALGDLLRLTLKDTGRAMRSLGEELDFCDLYMGIERMRLGDRLIIDYAIEPEATSAEVPQLLLQPLFENAVRHGVARTLAACEVRLRALRQDGELSLTLENDGPLRSGPADTPPHGVGLANTLARLRLHYGDRFAFRYTDRPEGGVRIDLSIPYKRAEAAGIEDGEARYAAAGGVHAHADR